MRWPPLLLEVSEGRRRGDHLARFSDRLRRRSLNLARWSPRRRPSDTSNNNGGHRMATDGEIDFRSFTREQLDEALERIDRERFPLNYQALTAEIERRKWEAEVAARAGITGEASAPVRYRPEFTADPKEYFRIWIVNLALTIVTLGIYSAWAKVRKL